MSAMPSLPLLKFWLTDRACLYPSRNTNMRTFKGLLAEKKQRAGCKALITIVACLYALVTLSLGQAALAVCLFASKIVEPTIFVGEILITIAVSSDRKLLVRRIYAVLTLALERFIDSGDRFIFSALWTMSPNKLVSKTTRCPEFHLLLASTSHDRCVDVCCWCWSGSSC